MDLKRVIPLLCFFSFCVWGGIKVIKNVRKSAQNKQEIRSTSVPYSGLGVYLGAPKVQALTLLEGSVLNSDECRVYVTALESLELHLTAGAATTLTYAQLPPVPNNCLMLDDSIVASEKSFLRSCSLANPEKIDGISIACASGLIDLRASLTHFIYKTRKLGEIEGLPELTDLAYYEFSSSRILSESRATGRDYLKLGSIADRMLDQTADLPGALKIKSIEAITSALRSSKMKSLKEQDRLWAEAAEAFEKLKHAQPSHFALEDLNTLIESRGFDSKPLMQYAITRLQSNPNDARAFFLKSFAHWKEHDHPEAFENLKKAIHLDPDAEIYRDVLRGLGETGATDQVYLSRFQTELSPRDFDR